MSVPLPSGMEHLGRLGLGGTAEVARVYVTSRRCEAAFKHPLGQDDESREEFIRLGRREQELIGRLRFPGLIRLLEFVQRPHPYLLLELSRGVTLEQVGRIDNSTLAANCISALALDLQFLHQHRLVHGDLKPQNVFLPQTWPPPSPESLFYLKLSDFSLGRHEDEPSDARVGLGTVGYMAPEVITDGVCNHRSDLFALGVIAYQLLTGQHPFIENDDADPVRISSRVREIDPAPLETFRDDFDPGLIEVVNGLLEKDSANRPTTAWEVCLALSDHGATYPFEQALQPKHLLLRERSFQENAEAVLKLNRRQQDRLRLLTGNDVNRLRLLLAENFRRGGLRFEGDKFVFDREIYWPAKMRRDLLCDFVHGSFGDRRQMVFAAIIGESPDPGRPIDSDGPKLSMRKPLTELIRPLLKPSTVKKQSLRPAVEAERRGDYEQAARLYLQAGDLTGCERCAYQACFTLNKNHKNDAALRLLSSVLSYAASGGRMFEVRQLLMLRGDILKETGAVEAAKTAYGALVGLYSDREPDKLLAETYKDLGDLYRLKQEHAKGLEALENALRIYGLLGDELEISHALNNLGNMHWVGSEYSAALKTYRKALRIQRRLDVVGDVASSLSNIGSIYVIRGKLDRAVRLYELSIDLCRREGNQLEEARILNNLGYVQTLRGEVTKAEDCLTRSLAINRRIGTRKEVLHNLENLTSVLATAGHLKRSIQYLKEGMALAKEMDDRPHLAAFGAGMGMTLKRMGRYSEAEEYYRRAESIYDEIDDDSNCATLKSGLADLRYRLGDTAMALKLAEESLRMRVAVNDKTQELHALMVLTRITDDPGYLERARQLARELKLKREATLVEFNALSRRLDGATDELTPAQFEPALVDLEQWPDEIETASLCILAGRLMLHVGRHEAARDFLDRAQRLAESFGLLPEKLESVTQVGRLHLTAGDYEKAYARFRSALHIAREVAGYINDAEDRGRFQSRPTITYLVSEIKKLAKALTK